MEGPGAAGNQFTVSTVRNNPSSSGVVTGKQTYMSFLNSMISKCGGVIIVLPFISFLRVFRCWRNWENRDTYLLVYKEHLKEH